MHISITQPDHLVQWFDPEEIISIFDHIGTSATFQMQPPGENQTTGLFRVTDLVTGKSKIAEITQPIAAAIFYIILHNDPDNSPSIDVLYEQIGATFNGWPRNLRPIP